jgi:dihydropyrimidinase
MLELMITGGLVVTPTRSAVLDVGIKGEWIAFVAEPGTVAADAARTIDATNHIVTPGGIEAHAHILEPMYRGWTRGEEVWLQSPDAATRAAIFGGTTSVASFAFMDVHTIKREFDCRVAIDDRRRVFHNHSYADYCFHPVLTGTPTEATLASIADAITDGTTSFKIFTTDVTTGQRGIRINDGSILEVMQIVAAHDGLVMAHAEDDDLVKYMEAKLAREGNDQWYNLHLVHTALSERIAFNTVIGLARSANAAVYFAHVTAAEGVKAIAEARSRGQPVYGEVLHNYMCFTAEDYKKADGGKYQTYPALKSEADRVGLWEGLANGTLSTVATDEYTTSYKIKTQGLTIATACGGHTGIETRGLIALSEGYRKGKLSLEQFVQVFATNPAKILGMYPQKGVIAPGSDADLTIWDPNVVKTIRRSDLHHDSDYSIWEGWPVEAWPVVTVLRGKVMVEHGELRGSPTDGQFIKCKMQPEILSRPSA